MFYAALIESFLLAEREGVDVVDGFDMKAFNEFFRYSGVAIRLNKISYRPISKSQEAFRFNFARGCLVPERQTLRVPARVDGVIHAVAGWFDLLFYRQNVVSSSP